MGLLVQTAHPGLCPDPVQVPPDKITSSLPRSRGDLLESQSNKVSSQEPDWVTQLVSG